LFLIQPVLTDLTHTTFDPELSPGARNAVQTCLRIQPGEKVTLITDNACREIAASLAQELTELGSPFKAFVLEDLAPRPLTDLPPEIAEDMETSQVSVFAVRVQRNELKSRMQMTDIVNRRKMRHAHMVNIDKQIMLEGMRADYNKVDALSRKVMDIVAQAKEIRATNPAGSDFTATLNPNYHWIKTSGIISRDKWGNLPGGEIFTVRRRRCGGRLLVREISGPGAAAADDSHAQQPHHRSFQRQQRVGAGILGLHAHRRK
jgi:leucyl aminopeptidase (aminopeptidase T)